MIKTAAADLLHFSAVVRHKHSPFYVGRNNKDVQPIQLNRNNVKLREAMKKIEAFIEHFICTCGIQGR